MLPADGGPARTLNLKSTYQPAHTVTLVGSAGKPANDALSGWLDGGPGLDRSKPPYDLLGTD